MKNIVPKTTSDWVSAQKDSGWYVLSAQACVYVCKKSIQIQVFKCCKHQSKCSNLCQLPCQQCSQNSNNLRGLRSIHGYTHAKWKEYKAKISKDLFQKQNRICSIVAEMKLKKPLNGEKRARHTKQNKLQPQNDAYVRTL